MLQPTSIYILVSIRSQALGLKIQNLAAIVSGRTAESDHSWEAAALLDQIREESQDTLIAVVDGENVSSILLTLLNRRRLLIVALASPFRNFHRPVSILIEGIEKRRTICQHEVAVYLFAVQAPNRISRRECFFSTKRLWPCVGPSGF